MSDVIDPLFEIQDQRLMKPGNPLLELERYIDWELFRSLLNCLRKSNAGASLRMP